MSEESSVSGRSSAASVHLDGLRVEYGDTAALDGVDLQVEPGEFFTLVGPSGCGKTTTLRTITGFETPTVGEVEIGGEPMQRVPPEDRGVGVVFQNYALFPHMTVAENVAYGLRFADPPGGASRDGRVRELLELVDLDGFDDRDPTTLSGGQRQRVSLARALAPGPRLLLLDEPMSALDAQLRERLRVQIREIQQELGITTVYVTHDQEEALAVSDRVAVMNSGKIEQVGVPRAVYRQPETRFVASFVGDNNAFEGEVVTDGGGHDRCTVAVNGTEFTVEDTSASELSGGDRVTVYVRPERLHVGPAENQFTVTVTQTEFLGETTRVHCDWEGHPVTLRADEELSGEVTVGFDVGDARVLSREE